MKKIFLFLVFVSLGILSSCSSDDGGGSGGGSGSGNKINMKINGTQKSFTSVDVESIYNPVDDYTDLEVTATISGSTPIILEMSLEKDNTDAGSVYWFQYIENGTYYQPSDSFTISITQNSDNKLIGSFSGTLTDSGDPMNTIAVTEGTFNIKY